MKTYQQSWQEKLVDEMGLVVALSGESRFEAMKSLRLKIHQLSPAQQIEIKAILKQRFTPTNGEDGCQSATRAVKIITKP